MALRSFRCVEVLRGFSACCYGVILVKGKDELIRISRVDLTSCESGRVLRSLETVRRFCKSGT